MFRIIGGLLILFALGCKSSSAVSDDGKHAQAWLEEWVAYQNDSPTYQLPFELPERSGPPVKRKFVPIFEVRKDEPIRIDEFVTRTETLHKLSNEKWDGDFLVAIEKDVSREQLRRLLQKLEKIEATPKFAFQLPNKPQLDDETLREASELASSNFRKTLAGEPIEPGPCEELSLFWAKRPKEGLGDYCSRGLVPVWERCGRNFDPKLFLAAGIRK